MGACQHCFVIIITSTATEICSALYVSAFSPDHFTSRNMPLTDPRFAAFEDPDFAGKSAGESSGSHSHDEDDEHDSLVGSKEGAISGSEDEDEEGGVGEGMFPDGFAGPSEKTVKPLTPEALAAFNAAQDKAGVLYISRIPPGMRPTKVRHLMSAYGEVGRVYLQQEGALYSLHGASPRR